MMAGLISTCAFIIVCCLSGQCFGSRKLLVFLIDGFRYDYIDDLENMPGFREIVDNGVKVDYMTPDFPSLFFPNYYSLMTGRHCEVHQMTGNYMWDQTSLKEFNIGTNPDSRLPMWWEGSEPLWVTVQKLKKDVYMYYWPGCEVTILGVRPAYCKLPESDTPGKHLTDAIEHALNALRGFWEKTSNNSLLEQNLHKYMSPPLKICTPIPNPGLVFTSRRGQVAMATVYYENIDVEGHHHGPQSPQVKTAILNLDVALQTLNRKIKEKNMQEDLNIMMFSDHGMTDIQWMEKVIELQLYINMSDIIKMMDRGPVVSLWPKPAKFESFSQLFGCISHNRLNVCMTARTFIKTLTNIMDDRQKQVYKNLSIARNMKVYKKPEIPQRFHYKGGKFVAALTLVADPGWFITESIAKLPYWQNGTGNGWQHGWHGYDNEFLDMRGFFLARGPDFRKNYKAAPIRTVDVYNLMCSVLGIQPLPNNGSWSRVEYMLSGAATQPTPFLLGTAAAVLLPLVLLPLVLTF